MAYLQNVCVQICAAFEQPLLGVKSRVSHEQHSEILKGEHDDDGVFVDVVLSINEECAVGGQYRKRRAVVGCPSVTAPCGSDRNTMQRRFLHPVVERAPAVGLPAVRDRPDAQRTYDRRKPTDVIAVGTRRTLHARLFVLGSPDGCALRDCDAAPATRRCAG